MAEGSNSNEELLTASKLLETLKTSVEDTFAAMLISFSEATRHEEQSDESDHREGIEPSAEIEYQSSVEFSGALAGSVVLRCTAHGAQDIARGLLMLEDGETLELEEICDALGECVNLISGTLKTKALDPIAEFTMSVPVTTGPELINTPDSAQGKTLAYQLSKGLLTAEVWLS